MPEAPGVHIPKPLSDPHICLEPSKTFSSQDKQTLTTHDLGKYDLPHQRGSGLLCCLWRETGHEKGALPRHVQQKEGALNLQSKHAVFCSLWSRFTPRSKLLIVGVFLPSHKCYPRSENYKYFRMKSCPMSWKLFLSLTSLTGRSQGMDMNPAASIKGPLFRPAPWNQPGPWGNQDWVASQFPSLTICVLAGYLISPTLHLLTFKGN